MTRGLNSHAQNRGRRLRMDSRGTENKWLEEHPSSSCECCIYLLHYIRRRVRDMWHYFEVDWYKCSYDDTPLVIDGVCSSVKEKESAYMEVEEDD